MAKGYKGTDEHNGIRRFVDWGEWTISFWEGDRQHPKRRRATIFFAERYGGHPDGEEHQKYRDMQRRWIHERVLPRQRSMAEVIDFWFKPQPLHHSPEDPDAA